MKDSFKNTESGSSNSDHWCPQKKSLRHPTEWQTSESIDAEFNAIQKGLEWIESVLTIEWDLLVLFVKDHFAYDLIK